MKKESVNTFSGGQDGGMMLDLHPSTTPNTVLTDNLNGTFITYNGNEYCLQNDRGNFEVASLTEGFVPIGAKEYNGIIYIISVLDVLNENGDIDTSECLTEIGTYPGIDWSSPRDDVGEAKGVLDYTLYTPLGNFKKEDSEEYGDFRTKGLGYSTLTPVTIEIEPSYDGSVNLIITDGHNPVRIINSGFSVLPNDEYKLIKRNQTVETNAYDGSKLEDLNLIRTTNILTNIDLVEVTSGGQLKGGNYTFYLKFGDADYNQTDIVAESGIVSIFKGNDCTPSVISGTVLDERTDKMIHLNIDGLNHTYSKIYVYYSREYSDTLGYRMTEYGALKDPFEMNLNGTEQDIWISGYEQTEVINRNELLIDYHTFDNARAMTQQQNMLFLGNLGSTETFKLYEKLKRLASTIETNIVQQESFEQVDFEYNKDVPSDSYNSEYYSTQNIYKYVGYWPNEWYRFGVVFILKDGATTPVFNMHGGYWNNKGELESFKDRNGDDLEKDNCYGIFKTPKRDIFQESDQIKPLCFQFKFSEWDNLKELGVIGYFYVRQKRIPVTLCQGLSLGIDSRSHLPVTWNGKRWITQSFLSLDREILYDNVDMSKVSADNSLWGLMAKLQYFGSKITAYDSNEYDEYDYSTSLVKYIIYLNNSSTCNTYEEFKNTIGNIKYNTDISILQTDTLTDPDLIAQISTPIYIYRFKLRAAMLYFGKGQWGFGEDADNKTYVFVSNKPITDLPKFLNFSEQGLDVCYWTDTYDFKTAGNEAIKHNQNVEKGVAGSIPSDFQNKYIVYPENSEVLKKVDRHAILSLDPCVVPTIRNVLDGSKFDIIFENATNTEFGSEKMYDLLKGSTINNKLLHIYERQSTSQNNLIDRAKCVYVGPDTKIKEIDGIGFSNIAGSAEDISQYSYTSDAIAVRDNYRKKRKNGANHMYRYFKLLDTFNTSEESTWEGVITTDRNRSECKIGFNSILNVNIVRGKFTPYVGVLSDNLSNHGIYSIKTIQPKNENGEEDYEKCFLIRKQDESPYYTVSNRIGQPEEKLSDEQSDVQYTFVYRGDCFTNTVSMRIIRNFIDPDVPISDNIVDYQSWDFHVRRWGDSGNKGDDAMDSIEWNEVNRADVNTVDLGYWVTYKCLSSYNLGLRTEDYSNVEELKLLGSPRSFYPLNGGSVATGNKMEESFILNDGYSATVSAKTFDLLPNVPYSTSEFANRIMFSNMQVDGAYTNGYRIFQGVAFKDYDKQYGAITKLLQFDNNLFVVMEHGIGIVGVNEQALMQTSTGDAIHIYGHGVLSDQMQIISPDYGSKYEHSVIRTPIGVYGIDTDARKIWRFSTTNGFQTLSDMKIETYLNDELGTNSSIDLPLVDVRTHYNSTKGDLMFCFYKLNGNSPKKEITPNEDDYLYLNTSNVITTPNTTVTKVISTNLDNVDVSSNDENVATVSVNLENNTLTITAIADGVCSICCGNKTFSVKVLNDQEVAAMEQEQAAQASNTIVVTEVDPETGEETVVVKSNTVIYAASYDRTAEVGSVNVLNVGFRNNKSNLTLNDCNIEVISDGEGAADTNVVNNSIWITPTADGKIKIKVSHPDATGFETNWISISTPVFHVSENPGYYDGDTFMLRIARGQYSESIYYHGATQPVTVNIEDSNIAAGGTNSDSDLLWFYGKHLGDTNCTVTCGDSVVNIIVSVYEHPYLQGLQFYDGDQEIDQIEGFSMQVGETKHLTFETIPEDLSMTTYSGEVVLENNDPIVAGNTVASHTYSFSGKYCNITALSAGTIKLKFVMYPYADGGTTTNTIIPITVYE